MDMQEPSGALARRGVPTYVVEAVVAALVLVMALVVVIGSWRLGAGWTSDGPASGYFPFYVGCILCIASGGTLYQAVFGKKRNTEVFVEREQLRRVLTVLIPAAVYVFAIEFVGIYIASAVYIAGFMTVLGKFSRLRSVVAAVVICALFFMMFEVWFKVPLIKGSLDPLSFLGY
jgi:hypothetical protein